MFRIWPDPRGWSIQQLAEGQEIDLAARLEPGHILAKHNETVGLDHRGQDAGTVARKLARDPAPLPVRFEPRPDILTAFGLLAVVEAGAHAPASRHDLGGAGQTQDEWARENEKRHHDGDRIARQTHEGDAADLAES